MGRQLALRRSLFSGLRLSEGRLESDPHQEQSRDRCYLESTYRPLIFHRRSLFAGLNWCLMSDVATRRTYRILDASANRVSEGFRCLEEFARFVLDDSGTTATLKTLRHEVAAAASRLPRQSLLAARDTAGDVGTSISCESESTREHLADVVSAAAARTVQSLRVLEEYGKLIDTGFAAAIEQVRYRSYTLLATLEQQANQLRCAVNERRRRLADARLYVLIDGGPSETEFRESVGLMYQAGVDVLQLRDRTSDDRTQIARARMGTEIARRHGGLFIVNDRADLAVAADADGVHVGQEELPAVFARQIIGPERLLGISTHNREQASQAQADGADYIGYGPIFRGRTKQFDRYVGTSLLGQLAEEVACPAFAIGGIDASNLDQVLRAGFKRIAVSGVVRDAADPSAAIRQLRRQLRGRVVVEKNQPEA